MIGEFMRELEEGVIHVVDVWRTARDAETLGYVVESLEEDRTVLLKRQYGGWRSHALIALVSFWFTFGIGNVLWAAFCWFRRPELTVVRVQTGE